MDARSTGGAGGSGGAAAAAAAAGGGGGGGAYAGGEGGASGGGAGGIDPMREIIVLAACGANELLPQVGDAVVVVMTERVHCVCVAAVDGISTNS